MKYFCEQCKDRGFIIAGPTFEPHLVECRSCYALYGLPYCRRCESIKKVLIEVSARTGQNLCWFNPEALQQLLRIFGISPPKKFRLVPREDFEEG